jgi:hypothetical protein
MSTGTGASILTNCRLCGCGNVIRQACSAWRWMSGSGEPYVRSPAIGDPVEARCTRIWCVRPVPSRQLISEYPSSLAMTEYVVSLGTPAGSAMTLRRSAGSRRSGNAIRPSDGCGVPRTIARYSLITRAAPGTYVFFVANPPQDAIEKRSRRIAERWMDDHPCWFVHGHQRIVFVKDVERYWLRDGAFAHARADWQCHFDGGSFANVHRCPARRRPIDRYQTFGYPSLRTGPRHTGNLGNAPDQHLIQS